MTLTFVSAGIFVTLAQWWSQMGVKHFRAGGQAVLGCLGTRPTFFCGGEAQTTLRFSRVLSAALHSGRTATTAVSLSAFDVTRSASQQAQGIVIVHRSYAVTDVLVFRRHSELHPVPFQPFAAENRPRALAYTAVLVHCNIVYQFRYPCGPHNLLPCRARGDRVRRKPSKDTIAAKLCVRQKPRREDTSLFVPEAHEYGRLSLINIRCGRRCATSRPCARACGAVEGVRRISPALSTRCRFCDCLRQLRKDMRATLVSFVERRSPALASLAVSDVIDRRYASRVERKSFRLERRTLFVASRCFDRCLIALLFRLRFLAACGLRVRWRQVASAREAAGRRLHAYLLFQLRLAKRRPSRSTRAVRNTEIYSKIFAYLS